MAHSDERLRIERVIAGVEPRPTLVDVGASYSLPEIWQPIAHASVYVGFDPDLREINELETGAFAKSYMIDRAVTSDVEVDEVAFYLTTFAACSSTLEPDHDALSSYLFAPMFSVERQVRVKATTLNEALRSVSVSHVDWLKTDSQGTDLRLFMSLAPEIRSRLLVLDIEPGLIDAYRGEDLFVDAHRELAQEGFWLSDLRVGGAVRMRSETLEWTAGFSNAEERKALESSTRGSPCWVEARYIRTIEWLRAHNASERDLRLLWVFSLLDEQYGFALDVAREYERNFGAGAVPVEMRSLHMPGRATQLNRLAVRAKRLVPAPVRQALRRALGV